MQTLSSVMATSSWSSHFLWFRKTRILQQELNNVVGQWKYWKQYSKYCGLIRTLCSQLNTPFSNISLRKIERFTNWQRILPFYFTSSPPPYIGILLNFLDQLLNNFNTLLVFDFCIDKTTASDSINPIELSLCKGVCELAARLEL